MKEDQCATAAFTFLINEFDPASVRKYESMFLERESV